MSAIEELLYNGTRPTTSEPGIWYVRIKPYNPRAGLLLRSLTMSKHGLRIKEQQGWKRLKNPSTELLRDLFAYQNEPAGENSPKAFDVCTFEEGKSVERREKEAKIKKQETRADIEHAGVLTTADLPSGQKSRADLRRENNARKAAERQAEREERERRRSAKADAEEAEERDAQRARIAREQAAAEAELAELEAAEKAAGEKTDDAGEHDDDDPLGLDG